MPVKYLAPCLVFIRQPVTIRLWGLVWCLSNLRLSKTLEQNSQMGGLQGEIRINASSLGPGVCFLGWMAHRNHTKPLFPDARPGGLQLPRPIRGPSFTCQLQRWLTCGPRRWWHLRNLVNGWTSISGLWNIFNDQLGTEDTDRAKLKGKQKPPTNQPTNKRRGLWTI